MSVSFQSRNTKLLHLTFSVWFASPHQRSVEKQQSRVIFNRHKWGKPALSGTLFFIYSQREFKTDKKRLMTLRLEQKWWTNWQLWFWNLLNEEAGLDIHISATFQKKKNTQTNVEHHSPLFPSPLSIAHLVVSDWLFTLASEIARQKHNETHTHCC